MSSLAALLKQAGGGKAPRKATRKAPRKAPGKMPHARGFKKTLEQKGGVRFPDPVHKAIEDGVSSFMVSNFGDEIQAFTHKLGASLGKADAMVYLHGSGAMHAMLNDPRPSMQEVLGEFNEDIWNKYFYDTASLLRDVDIKVVARKDPPTCTNVTRCDNFAVQAVHENMRLLIHAIHNKIADLHLDQFLEGILTSINNFLQAEGMEPAIRVAVIDSQHVHIEPVGKGNAVKNKIYRKVDNVADPNNNKGRVECGDDNRMKRVDSMGHNPGKACYPLRQQTNTTIHYTSVEDKTTDFILHRTALVVAVFFGDDSLKVVEANFVDVSVLRKDDMAYPGAINPGASVAAVNEYSGWPVPDLAYLYDAAALKVANLTMLAVDPDQAAHIEDIKHALEKSNIRLEAIAMLKDRMGSWAPQTGGHAQPMRQVGGRFAMPPQKTRSGAEFVEDCKKACMTLANGVAWWTDIKTKKFFAKVGQDVIEADRKELIKLFGSRATSLKATRASLSLPHKLSMQKTMTMPFNYTAAAATAATAAGGGKTRRRV
jgi:hypothetical protein